VVLAVDAPMVLGEAVTKNLVPVVSRDGIRVWCMEWGTRGLGSGV